MISAIAIKLIIVVAAGVVGAAGAINRARHRSRLRAKLAAASREVDDNALVTLTGTVKALGELLTAPLSGKPCVAYRAVGRTYELRNPGFVLLAGRGLGGRRALAHALVDSAMTPFVLATKTGDVIVDGETCTLVPPGLPLIPRKLEREQQFLDERVVDADAARAGFDECRIEVGAKIKVHGVSRSELASTGGETGFREAPTRVTLTGDDAHPLTIDLA